MLPGAEDDLEVLLLADEDGLVAVALLDVADFDAAAEAADDELDAGAVADGVALGPATTTLRTTSPAGDRYKAVLSPTSDKVAMEKA